MKTLRSFVFCAMAMLMPAPVLHAQGWRAATAAELESALPARAPVEKERIETEMRTASGIIDARGRMIAAVVLITAGYSVDGKYSHYLLVQSAIQLGDVLLQPGRYVLGWTRTPAGLLVRLYDAASGAEQGAVTARAMAVGTRVEAFRIWPPGERTIVQIGRFEVAYRLRDEAK